MDKGMKSEEIVRALQCISNPRMTRLCNGCKYRKSNGCDADLVGRDAASLIETLSVENAALRKQAPRWIDAKDRLPNAEQNYGWAHCIVTVSEWHASPFDEPYEREFVSTALFDAEQKIWHIGHYESTELAVNALIDIDNSFGISYCVTHWMPLPEVAEEGACHEPET